MDCKKIVFMTGTRADFGKLKPFIREVEESDRFEANIFATGMHLLPKYGVTAHEIFKCDFENVYFYNNQAFQLGMDISLANTIHGFSCYVRELEPDLIIVHGDRPEALAGAIVGSFNNVLVGHIEGGEISGTIDGLIRHAISKLSHAHFVANDKAKHRLMQMGESADSVFIVGSPEVDFMVSNKLPRLDEAKHWYEIPFEEYAIFIYHPVTTEIKQLSENVKQLVDAITESGLNYVVISPNNDTGSDLIFKEYRRFENMPNIRTLPSIRFEYFMTLFKNSKFIIGNSSAGVREAPIFGVPTINIGTRQIDRNRSDSIFDVAENKDDILGLIKYIDESNLKFEPCSNFGNGKSVDRIMGVLKDQMIWNLPLQKTFKDHHLKRLKLTVIDKNERLLI
ncbi:MAG: UDP-N-acetylglucosamine 2-epimerase [Phycisphaerales bacterium]|jgi:UDP-N-acetylglucosamine 2-epimerase (hydrolysing)